MKPGEGEPIWVDGKRYAAPPDGIRLIDWLREGAGCTSPKEGCGAGQCGACTVLVDDVPVLACCVLAMTVQGHQVRTAAGLSRTVVGSLLRESLVRHGGVQCGFCTPGMMVACVAWLQAPARADGNAASLRRALAGNICRCTGYSQIVDAARETAAMIAAPGVRELTMKADHEE